MEIKPEIKATPFAAYLVTRNSDGQDSACALTRGVWNVVDTGKFFAYEQDAYVEGEAFMCNNCSEWTIYPFNGLCPDCHERSRVTMKAKDLMLKALGFTSANFDGEVAAMMLGIDYPTDSLVDALEDAFTKLYRQIDEGELVLVPTKPRSERR